MLVENRSFYEIALLKLITLSWDDIWVGWRRGLIDKREIQAFAIDQAEQVIRSNKELKSPLIDLTACMDCKDDEIIDLLQKITNAPSLEYLHTGSDPVVALRWQHSNDVWRYAELEFARNNFFGRNLLERVAEIAATYGMPEDMLCCVYYMPSTKKTPIGEEELIVQINDFVNLLQDKIKSEMGYK